MITHDAVQFSGGDFVVSGRVRPAYFIGGQLTSLPGVPSLIPWKSSGMKASRSACYTGQNAFPMSGVTCCKNSFSYWNDFYSPA